MNPFEKRRKIQPILKFSEAQCGKVERGKVRSRAKQEEKQSEKQSEAKRIKVRSQLKQ